MEDDKPICPDCSTEMAYVRDMPWESAGDRSGVTVPLASSIFRCPSHGEFRVYISGTIEPYRNTNQG